MKHVKIVGIHEDDAFYDTDGLIGMTGNLLDDSRSVYDKHAREGRFFPTDGGFPMFFAGVYVEELKEKEND